MVKAFLLILFLLFSVSIANAAQSITLNGSSQYAVRTISNSTPFTSVTPWRVEMRVTDIASGAIYRLADNDHFYIQLNTSTGQLIVFSWDSEITDTTVTVNGFSSHLTDITIRVQKDSANNRYTVEAWDSDSATRFASGAGAATTSARNFGGDNFYIGAQSIEQNGSAGKYTNGRIAFFRWYSTVVSYESAIKPTLYANTADLLQYEFEGDGNDSSGNSQTLTQVGTPTFNTTPAITPVANAGTDVPGRVAGVTFGLDCSNSAAGDGGPITTYAWTRTAGSGSIASPSSATTNITGISAGQSTFQCEVGDGVTTDTDTVDVGVVDTNADGTVNVGNAGISRILGPMFPASHAGYTALPWYQQNQEDSFASHSRIPSVSPREDPAGTVSTSTSTATVTGSGTLFTKHVADNLPLYIGANTYTILSIDSDTQITLTANASATVSNTTDWHQNGAGEVSDLLSGYWHYYDLARNSYKACYETGLSKWCNEGDRLADGWWSSEAIDYGAIAMDNFRAPAPRTAALGGLWIRALRGKTEYYDWLHRHAEYHIDLWVMVRLNYPGLYFGTRDPGYALLYRLWDSQVLPDTYALYGNGTLAASTGTATDGATKRADAFADSISGAVNYFVRLQEKDGSWRWTVSEQNPLNGGIDSDDTSLTLDDAAAFPDTTFCGGSACDLKIDNEYLRYTTKTGNVLSGVTRGLYGTSAAAHSDNVLVTSIGAGYFEQSFHVGVGLGAALIDLLEIIEGNATYEQEYNAIRQAIILNAGEVMLMGYSMENVVDTSSIDSRYVYYAIHSWGDFGPPHDAMPDTVPGWPCLNGCTIGIFDIIYLKGGRQNISTWPHILAYAYRTTGVPWYKDQLEEVLSAGWGHASYPATFGTSDDYTGEQEAYLFNANNRRLKEYNEYHRYINHQLVWRSLATNAPANLPPFAVVSGDQYLTNGATSTTFTVNAIDPEGTSLTYQWSWSTAAACSGLTLANETTATVTVNGISSNQECAVKVVVSDADGNDIPAWGNFRTGVGTGQAFTNRAPVAAVVDQDISLSAGTTSTALLDASSSTDNETDTLHYRVWQLSGPAATVSNTDIANPTISGLSNGQTYTFMVMVYDAVTRSEPEAGVAAIPVRITVAASGGGASRKVTGKIKYKGKVRP
jgi:hypothetical protein